MLEEHIFNSEIDQEKIAIVAYNLCGILKSEDCDTLHEADFYNKLLKTNDYFLAYYIDDYTDRNISIDELREEIKEVLELKSYNEKFSSNKIEKVLKIICNEREKEK